LIINNYLTIEFAVLSIPVFNRDFFDFLNDKEEGSISKQRDQLVVF